MHPNLLRKVAYKLLQGQKGRKSQTSVKSAETITPWEKLQGQKNKQHCTTETYDISRKLLTMLTVAFKLIIRAPYFGKTGSQDLKKPLPKVLDHNPLQAFLSLLLVLGMIFWVCSIPQNLGEYCWGLKLLLALPRMFLGLRRSYLSSSSSHTCMLKAKPLLGQSSPQQNCVFPFQIVVTQHPFAHV